MRNPDLDRLVLAFPAAVQRTLALSLTGISRLSFRRRPTSLPAHGGSEHLTAIIRLGAHVVPEIEAPGHFVYPPHTVHITVTNLDGATVEVNAAISALGDRLPIAPTFHLGGVGCSPDTLFLRCVHDGAFGELRNALRGAFGMPSGFSPVRWLFDRLSFANVVRFDGRGQWLSAAAPPAMVVGLEVEIVRTDRYLSDDATVVLARIPLRTSRRLS